MPGFLFLLSLEEQVLRGPSSGQVQPFPFFDGCQRASMPDCVGGVACQKELRHLPQHGDYLQQDGWQHRRHPTAQSEVGWKIQLTGGLTGAFSRDMIYLRTTISSYGRYRLTAVSTVAAHSSTSLFFTFLIILTLCPLLRLSFTLVLRPRRSGTG